MTTQNEVLRALDAQEGGALWTVHPINSLELELHSGEDKARGDPQCFLKYLKVYEFAGRSAGV